jgi:hypothetical protein
VEGEGTYANIKGEHVQGRYNKYLDENNQSLNYAHVVGNGTADNARSNAHTLDWNGNAWFAGNVTVGEGTNNTLTTGAVVDDKIQKYVEGALNKEGNLSQEQIDKLAGIPADAEKNVQSDWNQTNSNDDAYIKNKPTIPMPDWNETDATSPHYIKNKPEYDVKYANGLVYLDNRENDQIIYLETK